MKVLEGVPKKEVDQEIRKELERAGVDCLESDYRSLVDSTLVGVVQFKQKGKVLILQRARRCWMLRIRAILRSPEMEKLNSYASSGYSMASRTRTTQQGLIIQYWGVNNQRKLATLIRALARRYGGIVKTTASLEELYEQRLFSDYSLAG